MIKGGVLSLYRLRSSGKKVSFKNRDPVYAYLGISLSPEQRKEVPTNNLRS